MRPATVLTATALAAALVAPFATAERQVIEGIVVRVNDRILTVADMRKRAAERAAETGAPVTPAMHAGLVTEAADDLCLLERATELKLEISEDEVNAQLNGLRQQNRIETDEQFEQTLRSMGLSVELLRTRMRDQMLISRVMQREVGNIPVTEEELRQRYAREQAQFAVPEHVRLEHLVFAVGSEREDLERAMARARQLVAAVRTGRDFAAVLKEETEAGNATGGDLGSVAVPDLRPEVRDAVAGLKNGEVADPFNSPAGVHVVRLVERVPAGVKPFSEVAAELRNREMDDRYRTRVRGVVDDLKKRYVVEVHPELFTPKP
jgi:parvulin-like peptidyl-prolyl isomerase